MFMNPRNPPGELLGCAVRENPAEPDKVLAEMPEPVERLVREPGEVRPIVQMLGCPHRSREILVAQTLWTG